MKIVSVKGKLTHLLRTLILRKVVEIMRRIVYQILLPMSVILLLVSLFPTAQAIPLVVVGREKVCNKVPKKMRKKKGCRKGIVIVFAFR
jgi:hypothetical protein